MNAEELAADFISLTAADFADKYPNAIAMLIAHNDALAAKVERLPDDMGRVGFDDVMRILRGEA